MDMRKIGRMVATVQSNLSDDLRKPLYRGAENCLAGHCYVGAESLFHMLGGKESGWTPHYVKHEGGPHWFLKHKASGTVVDPTASQFDTPVPYDQGIGKGFLTKEPSKRAQIVLDRIANGGVTLAKNIGFMTFPNLGEGVHTKPMTVTSEKYPTYRAMGNSKTPRTDTGDRGAMQFVDRYKDDTITPVAGKHRVLQGAVRTEPGMIPFDPSTSKRTFGTAQGTQKEVMDQMVRQRPVVQKIVAGKGLNATEGHETQHSVFIRLRQRFGADIGNQIVNKALADLHPDERTHIERLFHAARPGNTYPTEEQPEEKIAHLQNYLQDPSYRQSVHQKLGLKKPEEQRASQKLARQAWQSLQRWAQDLQPEEVGIAKSEVDVAPRQVACVAIFNSSGALLMGKRTDTGQWNCPGGKLEPGETPEQGARREVKEEAGMSIKGMKFLGRGIGGKNSNIEVYCYQAKSDEAPDGSNDPDQECDEWAWIDVSGGVPDEIKHSLHNRDNDILLQCLGLQEPKTEGKREEELSKSWKHAFAGAIAAATMGTSAMAQDDKPPEVHAAETWSSKGLHPDLVHIAQLESSGGKNVNHAKHPKGDFHTAVGAVGLKPVTAYDEYNKTPWLQKTFPNLQDQNTFVHEMKTNNSFYNHIATAHWTRLLKTWGGDAEKAAYSWRHGIGAAQRDTPEVQAGDPYRQAFAKMRAAAQAKKVGTHLINPLAKSEELLKMAGMGKKQLFDHYSVQEGLTELDPKCQGTGAVGQEANRPRRIPRVYLYRADTAPEQHVAAGSKAKYRVELPASAKLYDLGADEHGLMEPTIRQTKHGTFYETPELDDVEKKIKKMGYVGYHNYHPTVPNAVAIFTKVKAKRI